MSNTTKPSSAHGHYVSPCLSKLTIFIPTIHPPSSRALSILHQPRFQLSLTESNEIPQPKPLVPTLTLLSLLLDLPKDAPL
jgi:hypothetical protein